MITAFANTMKVPDLRSRILFTLAMIVIVRLGVHLPLPGVDVETLKNYMETQAQNGDNPLGALGAILTIFSGGGLQQCGIFALGIMPYISASIMTQLMGAVIPSFKKMLREEGGRQKMTKITRLLAIIIAVIQGYLLTLSLRNPSSIGLDVGDLVLNPGFIFTTTTIFIIVTGTMFLMWIGDQITDRGIGNGISLIISVNIISALPGAFAIAWTTCVGSGAEINPLGALGIVALILFMVLVVALVVTITQAQRRIPVQQAKRMVGRKMMNGGTQYLPLKLNYSGVMPVIFATAILALPVMVVRQIWGDNSSITHVVNILMSPTDVGYYIISALMIFFFSYFWVATMFQPQQISEDMQRSGSYIPGIRPGQPTATYLDQTMSRLTFAGSLFLTLIYFLPSLLYVWGGLNMVVTQFFGGTSLLILVGVLLDVMRQVEATLLQKNYDGFMRKSRNRSKYSHLQGGGSENNTGLVALWLIIAAFVLAGAVIMSI
ncbi:MAG: preprotein translocase subunit SecY [Akkermansiaceae bacterium]|nr:preprotein translocase subunit SecY [Akkermansiaceae bacterium]